MALWHDSYDMLWSSLSTHAYHVYIHSEFPTWEIPTLMVTAGRWSASNSFPGAGCIPLHGAAQGPERAFSADSGQQLALAARPVGCYNLCWEICYNWLTLWCIIDVSTIGDASRWYDLVWLTNTSLAMVEKWRLDLGSFQLQQAAFADLSFSGELHSFICSASMPSTKWNPRCTMLCNAILPDYILQSVWTLRCQQQWTVWKKQEGRGAALQNEKWSQPENRDKLEDRKLSALIQQMHARKCSDIMPEVIFGGKVNTPQTVISSDNAWLQKAYVSSKPGWLMMIEWLEMALPCVCVREEVARISRRDASQDVRRTLAARLLLRNNMEYPLVN